MSRIHDALKKAEQDRMRDVIATPAEMSADTATEPVSSERARPEMVSGSISFDTLLARCERPKWSPDAEKMLFFEDQHRRGTEEFRTLRSRLYQAREKQVLKTVLVASAMPAEGKSFIAANLAAAMVRQQGRRALLIDCDLRWSRLHQSLGAPSSPGLSEYLQGEADEFAILQRGTLDNLFFIPGGKPMPNSAELLANGRMKTLLKRLEPAFDWILVDSPPVVPISDATLLAGLCDGVVLVIHAGVTSLELARKALREFEGKPLLGAVLNRVEPKAAYSSYYYGPYASTPTAT